MQGQGGKWKICQAGELKYGEHGTKQPVRLGVGGVRSSNSQGKAIAKEYD